MILPKLAVDAVILSQQELAADVFRMVVEAPAIASQAEPGQFVQLRLLTGSFVLRRPVGIAEVDEKKGTISFIYRVVGKGTKAFSELVNGEVVNVLGPLGHGFDTTAHHPLIVGGGMGLSPVLFYAAAMQGRADVLMGGKTADELFWEKLYQPVTGQIFCTTDDGSRGRDSDLTKYHLPESSCTMATASIMAPFLSVTARTSARAAVPPGGTGISTFFFTTG